MIGKNQINQDLANLGAAITLNNVQINCLSNEAKEVAVSMTKTN